MSAPGFTGSPLDRADRLRQHSDALAAAEADPRALLLRLGEGHAPQVEADGRLGWGPLGGRRDGVPVMLLGLDPDGVPCFAELTGVAGGVAFRAPQLTDALARMRPGEAATWAAARSVIDWHARSGFCANCGHATHPFRGGWGRRCPNCATEHFPRVDPVVITVAEHDGRALVGRQPSWPAGRYSALAGFLEPGESVEEAVARELMEEAGVHVGAVRYVASQPWPFPSQLMIACIAEARDDRITLDQHELEHAMWVTRDQVRAALAGAGPFQAPPPHAIAHTLLSGWAAAG